MRLGRSPNELAQEFEPSAETIRQEIGTPFYPFHQSDYDLALLETREGLGKQTFELVWKAGQNMSVKEVVALAREAWQ